MAGRCVIAGFATALALGASLAHAQDAAAGNVTKQQCLAGALPESALPLNFTEVRPPLDLACIRSVREAEGKKSTRAGYHYRYVFDVMPDGSTANIREEWIDAACMSDKVADYISKLRYQCSAEGAKDMRLSMKQSVPGL
ncbi:MAG: hypothetical protein R3C60_09420 [Parvularculaceae bacterium]